MYFPPGNPMLNALYFAVAIALGLYLQREYFFHTKINEFHTKINELEERLKERDLLIERMRVIIIYNDRQDQLANLERKGPADIPVNPAKELNVIDLKDLNTDAKPKIS